jgi:hypothetical protein
MTSKPFAIPHIPMADLPKASSHQDDGAEGIPAYSYRKDEISSTKLKEADGRVSCFLKDLLNRLIYHALDHEFCQ